MAPEQAAGEGPRGRPGGRRLFARGDPLRAARRGPAVPLGDVAGDAPQARSNEEPVPPSRLPPEHPPRPGDDLPEVPGEVAPAPVWVGAANWPRTSTGSSITSRSGPGPSPAAERLWRWCRRKAGLAVALAPGLAAILATMGLSISLAVYHYQAAPADQVGTDRGRGSAAADRPARGRPGVRPRPAPLRAGRRRPGPALARPRAAGRRPGRGCRDWSGALPAEHRRLAGPAPPAPAAVGASRVR